MQHLSRSIQRLIRRLDWRVNRASAAQPLVAERPPGTVRLPATYADAARSLAEAPALVSSEYRGRQFFAPVTGCHPELVDFQRHFRTALESRLIPMYVFEWRRSAERQRALRDIGRSKAGPGHSPHNFGCAFDLVHLSRLWDLTQREWAVIGAIGKEVARKRKCDVVWGGDWKFYDPAHWELRRWRDYREAELRLSQRGELIPEDGALRFNVLDAEVAGAQGVA